MAEHSSDLDAVRTSVDNSEGDGLYILTGSTVIDESKIIIGVLEDLIGY